MAHTNKPLSAEKKCLVLALLTEGTAIKTIMRVTKTGAHQVLRLLLDAGETARAWHDKHARGLKCLFVECDELWSYVGEHQYRLTPDYDKERDGMRGHCWLFSATCAESKFVVTWRNEPDRTSAAVTAMFDQIFDRVPGNFQLTGDKFKPFLYEMRKRNCDRFAGGWEYKKFGGATQDDRTQRVVECLLGVERGKVCGNVDIARTTTAHQERFHLSSRTRIKRFNRRTACYSKSFPHHDAACALAMHNHNWMRKSEAAKIKGKTPAMVQGLASESMSLESFVQEIEKYIAKREEIKWEEAFAAKGLTLKPEPKPYKPRPLRIRLKSWSSDPDSGGPRPPIHLRKPGIRYADWSDGPEEWMDKDTGRRIPPPSDCDPVL